jgi:phosphatidylglycerophosphate synthase
MDRIRRHAGSSIVSHGYGGSVTTSTHPVAELTPDAPVAGVAGQAALLAALGATVGLGPAGWAAGGAFAVGLWLLLGRGLRRSGLREFGPANQVTLVRAALTGGVTALVADGFTRPAPVAALVALATVALVLDGVDGQVARRTGTASAFGARFDMEVDAFLILVLSVAVAADLGPWVLAIGALRYVFVMAAWALPWLRAALPPRFARKAVAAAQGIVLAVAVADVLPGVLTAGVVGAALAALCWSFGRDVRWLRRVAGPRRVPRALCAEPRVSDVVVAVRS